MGADTDPPHQPGAVTDDLPGFSKKNEKEDPTALDYLGKPSP